MTEPALTKMNGSSDPQPGGLATEPAPVPEPVIDLRESTTRVRVSRDDNPFMALSKPERMKLIIRVLCEIVAYGEVDDDPPLDSRS